MNQCVLITKDVHLELLIFMEYLTFNGEQWRTESEHWYMMTDSCSVQYKSVYLPSEILINNQYSLATKKNYQWCTTVTMKLDSVTLSIKHQQACGVGGGDHTTPGAGQLSARETRTRW